MHSVTSKHAVEHSDIIKESALVPGDFVNTDRYECRVKDRLPNTRGKEILQIFVEYPYF